MIEICILTELRRLPLPLVGPEYKLLVGILPAYVRYVPTVASFKQKHLKRWHDHDLLLTLYFWVSSLSCKKITEKTNEWLIITVNILNPHVAVAARSRHLPLHFCITYLNVSRNNTWGKGSPQSVHKSKLEISNVFSAKLNTFLKHVSHILGV